jgi:hypothetical protein
MQKQCLNQLTNSKYLIQAYLRLFIRKYICRLDRRIMIVLKTLFKHFGLGHFQYSITPTLQYPDLPCRQGFLSIQRPLNVAIQYDCIGVSHAPI